MRRYMVSWTGTEIGIHPPLETRSVGARSIYCFTSQSEEEAQEAFGDELRKTSLQSISNLDYDPTEKEVRQKGVMLQIVLIDSEDRYSEIIQNSELYLVED